MMWETPKGSQYIKEESNNILKEVFMKMKTKRKALLLSLCAVLLVVASVMGTMAYLTDRDTVTNTFTVGKVEITLDETKVDKYGKVDTTVTEPVKENEYLLVPGQEYTKDPTVHVKPESEDSWVFVKVDNAIATLEADSVEGGYQQITRQIINNNWNQLTDADGNDVAGVYYRVYAPTTTPAADTNYLVFGNFKLKDNADKETDVWGAANTTITVTAYAIQKAGFDTPAAAWAEVSK